MFLNRIYKYFILIILLFFIFSIAFSKPVRIARDRTLLKDGPGNFYNTITVLRIGATVDYYKNSKDDPGWAEISYNKKKGFVSNMAFRETNKSVGNKFEDLDFSNRKNEIAPASYTAAIKGFVLDYSKKKGFSVNNFDSLMALTNFKAIDVFKVRNETKLAYFPKNDGELIGVKDGYINQNMKAYGLTASINVLGKGVVMDKEMTKRLNIIANILNRQTWDYDTRYRVWIIKDVEPVAFSGPGGYLFFSDKLLKTLTDYRELVAIIAHEIGHIALRHGIKDLAVEEARNSANEAFDELDSTFNENELAVSDDLDSVIDEAIKACALVRDDKEEFEADDVSSELLRRYKIDKKFLIDALIKINSVLLDKYPEYKEQMIKRINRLKNK